MVFEGELSVKLHATDVEVLTSINGNPRQDQVTMGRVHSPRSTYNLSIGLVRIQYHAPVIAPLLIPSQVPVNGGRNSRSVYCLASSCQ